MEENRFVQKCVTIKKEQESFLKDEGGFKLSKFLQSKLDEYIKLRKDYMEFVEKEVIEDGEENVE